jgi:hypothetical protein
MKQFLLTLLIAFTCTNLYSKEKFGIDLGVGMKAGLNFNKVTGKGIDEVFHTDPHAGFFVHLNKRLLGVQLEALWTQSHITTDTSFYGLYDQYLNQGIDSLNKASFRFSTISLPILLNVKLTQFLWLQLGPQFNANVSIADKSNIVQSGKDIIAQNNYSGVAGLWLQFGGKAPLLRFNMGVRYIAGINNINELSYNPVWKNQMIQVHIGISY